MGTYDTSLKESVVDCDYARRIIKMAEAHDIRIVAVAIDAAHDTLIVAKEEDGKAGYAVDEDEESPLLELAGYIVARDVLHGYCCCCC